MNPSDFYDYRQELSVNDYAALQFMDSIISAAEDVPMFVFMDEANWNDPIVALAYKLFEDQLEEGK